MKFKVGDRVKIVATDVFDKKEYISNIVTITDVAGTCIYPYAVFENDYWWCDNELELVNEEFTKADLKSGMVVEDRNGDRRIFFGDEDDRNSMFLGKTSGIYLHAFTDTLEYNTRTIDRIYVSSAPSLDSYFDDEYLNLIWERPGKKMTIEEIEKELGYKIEIVDTKD